jgi:hypothetical protein
MDSFTGNSSQQATSNNTNQQKEDYLDKGLDAVEKKYGGASAQDTEKYRGVNEKIVCLLSSWLSTLFLSRHP